MTDEFRVANAQTFSKASCMKKTTFLVNLASLILGLKLSPFQPKAFAAENLAKSPVVVENDKTLPKSNITSGLNAQDAEKLKLVQSIAAKRKAMSVKFEQVFTSGISKSVRKSQGTLDYLAPVSFRWEVQSPRLEVYVNSPKEMISYTEVTKHAQKMPAGSLELDYVDLALNFSSLEKKYTVSSSQLIPVAPGEFCIELKPFTENLQQSILLVLNEKKAFVTKMKINSQNANTTLITFKDPTFFAKPSSRFDFTPPKGTAIDKL
jgi:chaperone LolA